MEQVIALLTLILLEVVLGLDNVIFISIVAARLPKEQQQKARRLGLLLAMVLRLVLLGLISIILKLEGDLFVVFGQGISGKDLILISGGLFLIYKSSKEIWHKTEGEEGDTSKNIKAHSFKGVIAQILILDLVFSVDSIITAVGMVDELWIMYVAVIVTVSIMLFASGPISAFINRHPAFKMLALSFLMLIGVSLMGEGLGFHIPKGYIYFSMAFALFVDILQMRTHKTKQPPVDLREHYDEGKRAGGNTRPGS
ncbi:TerC family protein [Flaviaesturariibacter flavus]|uniref:TerC family protein n=1 Tax=Flaviaesturariibacter flavus TaxID=2502780 RepID=A0A4R1BIE4_9BACT|nr:TerC family protein [Flaviaesturariibacter flavus]TCJ17050.1 TerC family protein [Flaviaesturariibacter flavus]